MHSPSVLPLFNSAKSIEIVHNSLYQIYYSKRTIEQSASPIGCIDYAKNSQFSSSFECINNCVEKQDSDSKVNCLYYFSYLYWENRSELINRSVCEHNRQVSDSIQDRLTS